MAIAAGYRIGLYTSPHLEEFTERISVNHQPIAGPELEKILLRILDLTQNAGVCPPTLFEALTLSALEHFATQSLDLAILEVGLGGRLDATNITDPLVSVITSIALDHEDYLGSTRQEIAREKCGILRPGRLAFTWGDGSEIDDVLRQEAGLRGANLSFARDHVSLRLSDNPETSPQIIHWRAPDRSTELDIELSLAGNHQRENLGLAIATAGALRSLGWREIGPTAVVEGARSCRWPGRAEWVFLPDGRRILLDGAHNPAGADALAAILEDLDEPPDLLFGALSDKDTEPMLARLASCCRKIVLTRPSDTRGLEPSQLAPLRSPRPVSVMPLPRAALEQALGTMQKDLVICGSLVLVGELRKELRRQFGVPPGIPVSPESTKE